MNPSLTVRALRGPACDWFPGRKRSGQVSSVEPALVADDGAGDGRDPGVGDLPGQEVDVGVGHGIVEAVRVARGREQRISRSHQPDVTVDHPFDGLGPGHHPRGEAVVGSEEGERRCAGEELLRAGGNERTIGEVAVAGTSGFRDRHATVIGKGGGRLLEGDDQTAVRLRLLEEDRHPTNGEEGRTNLGRRDRRCLARRAVVLLVGCPRLPR